jgi:hypothetical protein
LRGAGHCNTAFGARTSEQVAPALVTGRRIAVAMRQGGSHGGTVRAVGLSVESHLRIFADLAPEDNSLQEG